MTPDDELRPLDTPSFAGEIGLTCFWLAFGCIGAVMIAAAIEHLAFFLFSGFVD